MLQRSFRGFPAQPFLYDKTLSSHIVFFICVPLKTWRHFLQGSHSSSAFAWEKDVNSSSHHSCGPGAPFEPSLRPSDTGTNLLGVPASSCVPALLSWAQPTGWGPGLALAHPCPQAAACAQGWDCPPAVLFPGWGGEAVPCQLHGEPPLLVHPRELLDFTGTQVPRLRGRISTC